MSRRDRAFAFSAGLLTGLLALPVLKAVKPGAFAQLAPVTVPFFLIVLPLGLKLAHFFGKKASVVWQAGKFVVIGVLNTFVDWGVLTSLILLFRAYVHVDSRDVITAGITSYSLFKSASFLTANISSYYWNKYWTFDALTKSTKAEFLQFFVVSALGFAINVLIASFVFKSTHAAGGFTTDQWGMIGAAAGSAAGLLWNFIGYKFIVFKKHPAAFR